ncbi:MAG: type II glyceraldehyde-3-phosphate dehydrogenase [Halobacteriales archaeon]
MIEVGINGYGTIGKRVADAVTAQPDMTVAGVAKTSPNFEAMAAVERDYPLYAADPDRTSTFEAADVPLAGTVDELIERADVVVDATPAGIGARYAERYAEAGTPAVFQGGEDAEVAEVSFNAAANFEAARGADAARVVSCNTTGLVRVIHRLDEAYGVERVRATLVRRGGDPSQTGRGPINDILPNPVTLPSHHGPDVRTILPDIAIDTLGLKVPATLMHVHALNVVLGGDPDAEAVREHLDGEARLFLVDPAMDVDGTAKLKELALDAGRPRGDLWENAIWSESVTVDDGELYLFQAIHQESDVVPENVDAIRALLEATGASESRQITNEALGVGSL